MEGVRAQHVIQIDVSWRDWVRAQLVIQIDVSWNGCVHNLSFKLMFHGEMGACTTCHSNRCLMEGMHAQLVIQIDVSWKGCVHNMSFKSMSHVILDGPTEDRRRTRKES